MADLFIGITTWDDAPFVARTIPALQRTLRGVDVTYAAWDNGSHDDTLTVLQRLGVRCLAHPCRQSDALCGLLAMSDAPYTLLIHSDVLLIDAHWFPLLRDTMRQQELALISPEDIGFGPMLRREFGVAMPESSFMFFDTAKARTCMRPLLKPFARGLRQRHPVNPFRRFDFYGPHITHRIPALLARHGQRWQQMQPLTSIRTPQPWFAAPSGLSHHDWPAEAPYLDYGYGNFYAFAGVITHYHNWYARIIGQGQGDRYDADEFREVRRAYCDQATRRFFADLDAGRLHIPDVPRG